MTKRFLAVPAAAAALILLASCSAAEEVEPAAEPTTEAVEAVEPVEEPEPEEPTTTPAQWASIIAVQQASWDEWSSKWDGQCDFIAANHPDGILCRIQLTSANFMAQTSALTISGPTNPEAMTFLADEPPAEIASLYEGTLSAATYLEEQAAAWDEAGCSNEVQEACIALGREFERGIDDLKEEFIAWTPYL